MKSAATWSAMWSKPTRVFQAPASWWISAPRSRLPPVGPKASLLGTAITPGLGIAVQSLVSHTAQLPPVALEAPESPLGANTVDAIRSGIVLGYKGLVESLIAQFKDEMRRLEGMRQEDVRVIATGGLNSVLSPITNVFQSVDRHLTLYGLKRIADLALM